MRHPIVMLPGWGMKPEVFSPLLDTLRAPGARAHALPAKPTLADCAAHIAPSLEAGSIVCGWSLGGMLALHLATLHTPTAAVLIGTTPRFIAKEDWPHAVSPYDFAQFESHLTRDSAGLMRHFIQLQCMGSAAPRPLARLLYGHLIHDDDALRAGLAILREADLRGLAPAVPTLIIHGREDRLVPPAAAQALCDALPQGQLVIIDGAGHAPHVSHPHTVAAAIRSFVESLQCARRA